ncbi:hypothetical protein KUTeg_015539 [Tegillarca granosa]|uniref:Fatty acid hydroxylase domain-containing protein n=1 Tax=Tegillarca granosa TaxID=220873 RepID=A0ABQ9EVM6_TEGGR|nr:hypothetical protein KUTeg_015539 [Tegillarca granosa]
MEMDLSKEWKCQPDKFLTPENERHEILLGSFNMLLGSMASGVIACYVLNGAPFIGILLYTYYYGMIDHSGIKMEALWPWQPNTMFHDDHHRYFHCNFGFNSYLFDWMHGTLRVKEREYGEDIFGGFGRETTEKIKKSN